MKALVALGLLAASITLTPGTAGAQERTGDAALGALAGAVVAGPFGLVAGGVVGYTAGPGIASEWGCKWLCQGDPDVGSATILTHLTKRRFGRSGAELPGDDAIDITVLGNSGDLHGCGLAGLDDHPARVATQ